MEPRPQAAAPQPGPFERITEAQEVGGIAFSPFRLIMLGAMANVMMQNGALIENELRLKGWKRDWRVVAAANAAETIRHLDAAVSEEERMQLPTDEATLTMLAMDMMCLNRGMMRVYGSVLQRRADRLSAAEEETYAGAMFVFEVIADRGDLYRTLERLGRKGNAG